MAELRSFFIGVVVAGVLLGLVAIALGAFSGDSSDPIAARLLGSPVATSTPRVTPGPATTALPTLAPTTQPSATPDDAPTTEPTEPAAEPTNTPLPQPTADPVAVFVATIQPIAGDFDANIAFVIGQGSANPTGSTQAANTIKDLAARMAAASPPACLVSAHDTLTQGANQAAAAADQLIAALSTNNSGLVQAAISSFGTAQGTLNAGSAAVANAPC